jgi:hypothetical protein
MFAVLTNKIQPGGTYAEAREKVLRLLCHSPGVGLEVIPFSIGDWGLGMTYHYHSVEIAYSCIFF